MASGSTLSRAYATQAITSATSAHRPVVTLTEQGDNPI
jgi:hypothetical protein